MSERTRILVVDDDESIREMLDLSLSAEGYDVRCAPNGAVALALLQEWTPQLVLLDMKMPVADGWAFARAHRELSPPKPPVVVLTAARDAVQWAEEIAADGVLAKPFDLDNLLDIVNQFAAAT